MFFGVSGKFLFFDLDGGYKIVYFIKIYLVINFLCVVFRNCVLVYKTRFIKERKIKSFRVKFEFKCWFIIYYS